MKNKLILIFLISLSSCVTNVKRVPQSQPTLQTGHFSYDTKAIGVHSVNLRTGTMPETPESEFKGCVLYLEGLADSIQNHNTLFTSLAEAGFRVVTFDYMGQGGSDGSMNHSRIDDSLLPGLQIGNQAKAIWEKYSGECGQSKKFVIGWSTGGLAAYKLAYEGWADAVVLIAPGIHPNKFVGEAAKSAFLLASLQQVITERTLTTNHFENGNDPHVDPIKPISPAVVPLFATNLLVTAEFSHKWSIPSRVKGYVFLSGKEDTYVDAEATKSTLASKAPHFSVKEYEHALHEIDNEIPAISQDMIARTVGFFESESK